MSLLEARGLTKSYRSGSGRKQQSRTVVDDVSFDLERGTTLAIVGESGAGKSTLARMVLRLVEPDAGSVSLDGVSLLDLGRKELRAQRRNMQMIFQNPYGSLDPRLPIGTSVAEPLKVLFGTNRTDREVEARKLLRRVGLGDHHIDRRPHQLSGGQLQRVAIARALAADPALLVCDEAVSALDVSIRAEVLNLLLDLQEERQVAYLFITHDLAVVQVFAHHVLVMKSGKVMEVSPASQLFANPGHDYTRELLSAIPVIDLSLRFPS